MENKGLKFGKIVVLAGGPSKESAVSRMSAESVIAAMKNLGCNFEVLDPDENLVENLKLANPDVVFNCLHGKYGEDGAIQGVLEYLKIPYTHSGIFASNACFDKIKAYAMLENSGIRLINTDVMSVEDLQKCYKQGNHPKALPYVIKPVNEGSAIGVYVVKSDEDIPNLDKWNYGKNAIIQEYIPGKELTCTIFNNKSTVVTELRPNADFYNYEAKYTDGITDHIVPAEIPDEIAELCKQYSLIAHKTLGARTISRADFRYNPDEKDGLYFLELNTHPGCTTLSLVPEALKYEGISFENMVLQLLHDAKLEIEDLESQGRTLDDDDSNITEIYNEIKANRA